MLASLWHSTETAQAGSVDMGKAQTVISWLSTETAQAGSPTTTSVYTLPPLPQMAFP